MRDLETHYTCEFTAAEMGIVATALEDYRTYLTSNHGQADFSDDELEDAIATCEEALSEVTTRIPA